MYINVNKAGEKEKVGNFHFLKSLLQIKNKIIKG